jgi:iron(III) transport system ATP-binding protein
MPTISDDLTPQAEGDTLSSEPRVAVSDLRKTFRSRGEVVAALDGVSLTVAPSEMVVLLGPSGCGKTTLLRSVAGLETPDSGEISIEGRLVFSTGARSVDLPPEQRGVSFVFQSYALWPHMTVMANVIYPLQSMRVPRKEARKLGEETLALVGCEGLGARYPSELSGGQQQRVALARAIIARRNLIFFDEPLSNIDAKVREKLRLELLNIRDAVGFGGLYVTHDQDEAMILGDRVAVMNSGRILQVGTPREVYEAPGDRWVADFIGTANFVDGTVREQVGGEVVLSTAFGPVFAGTAATTFAPGDAATAFFRPEWAVLSNHEDSANAWRCTVQHTIYIGDRTEVVVDVDGRQYVIATAEPHRPGDSLWLNVDRARVRALNA